VLSLERINQIPVKGIAKAEEVQIIESFIKLCIESISPEPFDYLVEVIVPTLEKCRHIKIRSAEELGKGMGVEDGSNRIEVKDYSEVVEAIARRMNKIVPYYYDREKWKVECMFCGVSGDMMSDDRPVHLDTCEVTIIKRFLDKLDNK